MENMPMVVKSTVTDDERLELARLNLDQKFNYFTMRRKGESHRLALLLATRSFPSVRTDSTFLADRANGRQFEGCPQLGDAYKQIAEAHGASVTGKVYLSQLAEFPGDPQAWVSGRGDVERVCRDRGYSVEGAVNFKSGPRDPTPEIEVGEDIVESAVHDILADAPLRDRREVAEQARERLTAKVDNHPLLVSDPPESENDYIDFT